jgi:hypothetical protein
VSALSDIMDYSWAAVEHIGLAGYQYLWCIVEQALSTGSGGYPWFCLDVHRYPCDPTASKGPKDIAKISYRGPARSMDPSRAAG